MTKILGLALLAATAFLFSPAYNANAFILEEIKVDLSLDAATADAGFLDESATAAPKKKCKIVCPGNGNACRVEKPPQGNGGWTVYGNCNKSVKNECENMKKACNDSLPSGSQDAIGAVD